MKVIGAVNTTILELLASRICHDLISPVGAIHNGIEFMEEMGEAGNCKEALSLIMHSAGQASARLQMFRLVYGLGGRDSHIKPEDAHKAFGNMIAADGRVTQEWDPHAELGFGEALPEGYAKILAGTLMLAAECLPKGGVVMVSGDSQSAATRVIARGTNAAPREYAEEALIHLLPVSDVDPRLVHPYVMGLLCKEYGFSLVIEQNASDQVDLLLSRS